MDRVRRVIEERCQAIGKKVKLVVNYDNVFIDAAVADTYAAMVRYMQMHYYTTASRYTTSAFLRLKLGEALTRRRVAAAHLRDPRRGPRLRRDSTATPTSKGARHGHEKSSRQRRHPGNADPR